MKTQIFHLDNYDDILSARDRIGWSKAARILIVFPVKKNNNFTLTDYVLLAREADRNGAVIGFVLKNADIRLKLEQAGLLCFRSVDDANRSHWHIGKRMKAFGAENKPIGHSRKISIREREDTLHPSVELPVLLRIVLFLVAIIAVIVFVMIFIPKARVILTADQKEQNFSFTLQGDSERETAPYSSIIHIYPVEFTVEEELYYPVSGQITLPDTHAKGRIEMYNLTNRVFSIPAGLVVMASMDEPVQFKTTQSAEFTGEQGMYVEIPIEAVYPGESGNVPAGVIDTIAGDMGLYVSVKNSISTNGGTSITVSSPSANDVKIARDTLIAQLNASAIHEASSQMQEGQIFVRDSLEMTDILQEYIEPEAGQPGEEIFLRIQAQYSGWYILEEDVSNISTVFLDALLPDAYKSVDSSLVFEYTGDLHKTGSGFTQNVEISRSIESDIGQEEVFSHIMGLSKEKAANILETNLNLLRKPEIMISPDWWPIMPFFRYQYEIITQ